VSLSIVAVVLGVGAGTPGRALAQGKLEAHYVASLAGIPIGEGVWTVDIAHEQYNAAASGRTTGLVQVFAGGRGSAAAHGNVNGKPVSSSYAATLVMDKGIDAIRMALVGGNVKEYTAEPVWPVTPDRVPVTEAHRHGVVDPMSAWLMPVPGSGDPVRPEACNRTLAIFDGRGRFDLALSYKRMEQARADRGYQGPVVVCAVRYRPISGHRPNRSAIKYLMEQRDIEVALAPLSGTRVVVPYRVSVPTMLGPAVLEATRFVTGPYGTRATTNAKTF